MRLVIIESPYAGDVERNVEYARRAMRDSISRGECPIASHLLYTQPGILDDSIPSERERGVALGHAWMVVADAVIFYTDLGISTGMRLAEVMACNINENEYNLLDIEYRKLNEGEQQ
jgi:hypothetical protein